MLDQAQGHGGAQGGGGGVDQVVAEQDGGQQPFRSLDQAGNQVGAGVTGLNQVEQPDSGNGNKRGFRGGEEGREQQANQQQG